MSLRSRQLWVGVAVAGVDGVAEVVPYTPLGGVFCPYGLHAYVLDAGRVVHSASAVVGESQGPHVEPEPTDGLGARLVPQHEIAGTFLAALEAALDPSLCGLGLLGLRLAHLAADEPGGVLPDVAPGVLMDGDDIGRWLKRQRRDWRLLSGEQQERLSTLGVEPLEAPSPALAAKNTAKGSSKAQQAFQRGLTALAQWIEREGQRPVPRSHDEQVAVDGETEPVVVKLGVWISNTKQRRDKLTQEQLDALRRAGMQWAKE